MKRKTKITRQIMTAAEEKEHRQRLSEELGDEVLAALSKAYRLTAQAIFRRAKERAETRLQQVDN